MVYGSPVRSVGSEDEDDDLFPNSEKDVGDDVIMNWARVCIFSFCI